MEKPFFIKCEPEWPSDTEETSNVELGVELHAVNAEDVKVELAHSLVSPGTEEGTSVFVKEEPLTQDVKKEPDLEYYDNDGQLPDQMQPMYHSTTMTQSCEAQMEEIVSDSHNLETSFGDSDGSNVVEDGRATWTCDCCSKLFRTQLLLQEHVLIHGEDKLVSSPVNTVGNAVSYNKRSYSCDRCSPDRFCVECSSRLSNSGKTKSRRRKRQICCYCNKEFRFRSQLATHLRTHTGHKPYKCTVCDRAFADPSGLRRHEITHTGARVHTCTYCEKRFADKTSLNTHMNIHTGQRPYKCSECDKSFSAKCSFRRHVKTHKEDKPFKCLTCGKAFAAKSYLDKHMTRHTGVRSFSCTYCHWSFAEKWKLKTHLLTHTGEKPHSCPVCNRSFSLRSTLNRHRKIHGGQ